MQFLQIDYETRSEADLRVVGSAKYAEHPSTQILMISFSTWDDPDTVLNYSPFMPSTAREDNHHAKRELYKYINKVRNNPERYKIAAFHSEFEYWITSHVAPRQLVGFESVPIECFFCIMCLAGANSYAGSEANVAKAMKVAEKDKEGKRLIQMFSVPSRKAEEHFKDPRDYPEEFLRFFKYCDQDVDTQKAIHTKCFPFSDTQLEVFTLTEKMNARGVPVDIELVKGAIRLARKYARQATKRIQEITQGEIESASQTVALTKYLAKIGATVPNLQAPTIERFLAKDDLDPTVREILELRSNSSKSSIAKYAKALAMITKNGTVHGTLKAYLTVTGRWAGRGLQIQNYSKPNGKIFPRWADYDLEYLHTLIRKADFKGITQAYGDVMEVLKGTTRSMIRAPKGKKLITADYSSVEARIVMWLADSKKGLKDFAGEGRIYEAMAGTIFSLDPKQIRKGTFHRDLGKEAVLGCGFGMGADKFYQTVKGKNLPVDTALSKKAVQAYRKRYFEVKNAWTECGNACISVVNGKKGTVVSALKGKLKFQMKEKALVMTLPGGREIFYPEACIITQENNWGNPSETMHYKNIKSARGAGKEWGLTSAWGGIIFQHATQAIAGDLMAQGLLNVEAAKYYVIFTVHDEAVSLVDEDFGSVEEYEQLLCKQDSWAKGIPLLAEGWEGLYYRK